ncbi:MAG: hypothetical protein QOC75_2737, partial [Pseudonocardiales bacterium]|nr:hypothetical protein [Pseudonocardiales bacterium]
MAGTPVGTRHCTIDWHPHPSP